MTSGSEAGANEDALTMQERAVDVRWLIETTLEAFPHLFDNLDAFMVPPQRNQHALQAGYGPFHGDQPEMMKSILLEHHGVTRDELVRALEEIRGEDTHHRQAS